MTKVDTNWRGSTKVRAKGEGLFSRKLQLGIFNKREELKKGSTD